MHLILLLNFVKIVRVVNLPSFISCSKRLIPRYDPRLAKLLANEYYPIAIEIHQVLKEDG